MKVEKFVIQACCGRTQISFKIDRPIDEFLLQVLKSNGFTIADNFVKAGLLYADNLDLIVSGPFGSDKLNAGCKKSKADCERILNDFEALLIRAG